MIKRPHFTQLRAIQKQDLIDCLSTNIIEFKDNDGIVSDPALIKVTSSEEFQAHWFESLQNEDATFDQDGNELTPATFFDGYHADVLSKEPLTITAGVEEVTPLNPRHSICR